MKKFWAILLVVVLTTSMAAVASANVSGYTNGGDLGKTWIKGTLTVYNVTASGKDSATATTEAYIADDIRANVTIYCTDENGKEVQGHGAGGTISSTFATGTARAPSGSHAYKAVSAHVYISDGYGIFSKSDSASF